ncbi:hypothetical protein RUM44_000276 [Polyplax serrata]|uniref:Uncharacterized protein n=1 Tax=Polyplax serrata TaxID=468196 RepID=A0ABR1B6D4_POLSC
MFCKVIRTGRTDERGRTAGWEGRRERERDVDKSTEQQKKSGTQKQMASHEETGNGPNCPVTNSVYVELQMRLQQHLFVSPFDSGLRGTGQPDIKSNRVVQPSDRKSNSHRKYIKL